MWWLYNLLLTIASPVWIPWMLFRAAQRAEKVDWKQRAGELRIKLRPGATRLWFHAVSVGEVVAALPILKLLREQNPDLEIVLSVTTSSGHQTARDKASTLVDHIVYFPLDVPRFTLGALVKVKPTVVAIMETELWMNFLWAAKTVGATTIVLNGRLSDRSFPRAKKLRFFYKDLLACLDQALVQSPIDQQRFQDLGAQNVQVFGNCKFDQALEGTDADPGHWRKTLGLNPQDLVVVVGSTRGEAEENFVLQALADPRLQSIQDRPVKFIHAPRHLERAEPLADAATPLLGPPARRSKAQTFSPETRYLLLDTYGELASVYSVADVVVVGGAFDKLGGQNILQPLAHAKPVVHGPHMNNFRDAAELAARAGAAKIVETPAQLADTLHQLLANSQERDKMGQAAQTLVQANAGASERYAQAITQALSPSPHNQKQKQIKKPKTKKP